MIFILHKYIFRELLRVFALAAIALTFILSLGSTLQPIQEFGAGPRQVISLMGYFLPITLTFVLPMAALFAGALVYGRFASDNEIDACRASGISLFTLVYPGLALAVIVTIANLFLSFYVMPVFVHRAEKSLKADAKQIVFRNIQRKKYYALPPDQRYLMYADNVSMQNDTLAGVIIAEMKKSEIQRIVTAEAAKVTFNLNDRFNEVQILAIKPYQIGTEDTGSAEYFTSAIEFGSLLGDSIQFKKINEMRKIQNDPMLFDPIAQQAYETYAQLYTELLARDINARTKETSGNDGKRNFYEMIGEPNSVRFTANYCIARDDGQIDLIGDIEIIEYDTDSRQTLHTLKCEEASLNIEGDKLSPILTMDIHSSREDGTNQLRTSYIIRGLVPPNSVEAVASQFRTKSGSLKVHKLASKLSDLEPSKTLARQQFQLNWRVEKALAQIKAEIHSRLVFGIGCIPMILIGIGLGVFKKGGHLLSAFAASCLPAAVLVVCIMSGKQMTENIGARMISGVTLMWAGLFFMIALTGALYHTLLKH